MDYFEAQAKAMEEEQIKRYNDNPNPDPDQIMIEQQVSDMIYRFRQISKTYQY